MDPRDVDKVLTEAAEMSGRWSLFRKFVYDRLKVTRDPTSQSPLDSDLIPRATLLVRRIPLASIPSIQSPIH